MSTYQTKGLEQGWNNRARLAHLVPELQADTLHLTKTDFEITSNNSNNIIIKTKQLLFCSLKPVGRVYGHNISWCHQTVCITQVVPEKAAWMFCPHLSHTFPPPNQHLRPLYSLLFFTPYMLLRHLITSYRVINKSVTIFHGLYFIWSIREQTEKNCFLFVFYNNIDNHFR